MQAKKSVLLLLSALLAFSLRTAFPQAPPAAPLNPAIVVLQLIGQNPQAPDPRAAAWVQEKLARDPELSSYILEGQGKFFNPDGTLTELGERLQAHLQQLYAEAHIDVASTEPENLNSAVEIIRRVSQLKAEDLEARLMAYNPTPAQSGIPVTAPPPGNTQQETSRAREIIQTPQTTAQPLPSNPPGTPEGLLQQIGIPMKMKDDDGHEHTYYFWAEHTKGGAVFLRVSAVLENRILTQRFFVAANQKVKFKLADGDTLALITIDGDRDRITVEKTTHWFKSLRTIFDPDPFLAFSMTRDLLPTLREHLREKVAAGQSFIMNGRRVVTLHQITEGPGSRAVFDAETLEFIDAAHADASEATARVLEIPNPNGETKYYELKYDRDGVHYLPTTKPQPPEEKKEEKEKKPKTAHAGLPDVLKATREGGTEVELQAYDKLVEKYPENANWRFYVHPATRILFLVISKEGGEKEFQPIGPVDEIPKGFQFRFKEGGALDLEELQKQLEELRKHSEAEAQFPEEIEVPEVAEDDAVIRVVAKAYDPSIAGYTSPEKIGWRAYRTPSGRFWIQEKDKPRPIPLECKNQPVTGVQIAEGNKYRQICGSGTGRRTGGGGGPPATRNSFAPFDPSIVSERTGLDLAPAPGSDPKRGYLIYQDASTSAPERGVLFALKNAPYRNVVWLDVIENDSQKRSFPETSQLTIRPLPDGFKETHSLYTDWHKQEVQVRETGKEAPLCLLVYPTQPPKEGWVCKTIGRWCPERTKAPDCTSSLYPGQ